MVEYVLQKGDDLGFTKYFWKECETLEEDVSQYQKFFTSIRLAHEGWDYSAIAVEVRASASAVSSWIGLKKMPKLGYFLKSHLQLGEPLPGTVWLSVECTHGHAIPIGLFVQVPLTVNSWVDVKAVVDQLKPLDPAESHFDRYYLFGFLLGMIIGDSSKSKVGRSHRHLALSLSMRYATNLKIGEFTALSARSIGLRMHRTGDRPRPDTKPFGFYQWTSQSSPLIDWVFNTCLGLADGEVTTYNPLRAEWVLSAPHDFRLGLLQGLAESDGSVSIAGQEIEFWVGPNWALMKNLLATFGLRSFRSREATSLSKGEAVKAFRVPTFSPLLETIRYQRLRKLALGRKPAQGGERLPKEVRWEIKQLKLGGMSTSKIIEAILNKYGLVISFEAAERWANR